MIRIDKLKSDIENFHIDIIKDMYVSFDELNIVVDKNNILEIAESLKNKLGFEQLIDISGVDYLDYGNAEWNTNNATSTGFSRASSREIVNLQNINNNTSNKTRFGISYHFLSLSRNIRLRVKVLLKENEIIVPTVTKIWNIADWYEREVFDMFGIMFENHSDLRRILTDYGFIGHPLKKDFPQSGYVEMRYDNNLHRVVYEDVEIEPRINVAKVIREDNRYS